MLYKIVMCSLIRAEHYFMINIIHIQNCFNIHLDFEYHGSPNITLASISIE